MTNDPQHFKNILVFEYYARPTCHMMLVGCRVYGRLSHEGPRPMGGMPSVGVFLKNQGGIRFACCILRDVISREIILFLHGMNDVT